LLTDIENFQPRELLHQCPIRVEIILGHFLGALSGKARTLTRVGVDHSCFSYGQQHAQMRLRFATVLVLSVFAFFWVVRFAARQASREPVLGGYIKQSHTDDKDFEQVAVCIMLSQAHTLPFGGKVASSLDGAAALQRSILEAYNLTEAKTAERMVGLEPYNHNISKSEERMKPQVENVSVYQIELTKTKTVELRFIAMIDDDVDEKWIKVVRALGFEVWKTRSPVDLTEVRNEYFAKEIKSNGVLGIRELIKLEGLRMHAFQIVLFLDCDILFHKRFDELLEMKENYAWTISAYPEERTNGGFLVYNPNHPASMHHLDNIIELLREGDFRPGSGWKGTGIGWAWGGATIQGILPYYYFHEASKEQERLEQSLNLTLPPAHKELDKCQYNNWCKLDRCSNFTYEEVTSSHFTDTCSKPWYCIHSNDTPPLCDRFHVEFARHYKQVVLELMDDQNAIDVRNKMNGSEVVQFVNNVKDGEWCIGGRFESVSAFLYDHV
jgi:hypothetical protein